MVKQMTEQEWQRSNDPKAMIKHLRYGHGLPGEAWGPLKCASDRKLRLFIAAVEREWCGDRASVTDVAAFEVMERLADCDGERWQGERDRLRFSWSLSGLAVDDAAECVRIHNSEGDPALWANLLREIVGNPFRPVKVVKQSLQYLVTSKYRVIGDPSDRRCELIPDWLTDNVLRSAQQAYDRRDWDALPILADVLEEAGCEEQALMGHLRSTRCKLCKGEGKIDRPIICGPNTSEEKMRRIADEAGGPIICPPCKGVIWCNHVLVCWALDLILG